MGKNQTFTALSHSSANLLRSCEQRYYYYKVTKEEEDDYPDDKLALTFGSAVHQVLENCKHVLPSYEWTIEESRKACEEYGVVSEDDPEEYVAKVAASAIKYYQMHKASRLQTVACESAIEAKEVIGYIDAVMKEKDGYWWIVDIKTAASVYPNKLKSLHRDYQLNLYASFREEVAHMLQLDPNKFLGCRYRIIKKSKAHRKRYRVIKKSKAHRKRYRKPGEFKESLEDFILRLVGLISCHDISVSVEDMKPEEFLEAHQMMVAKAKSIHKGEVPSRNFNSCFNYFKPCPYWSKCHGELYTGEDKYMEIVY